MPNSSAMRFGDKDVVLAIEGRQDEVRPFAVACRSLVDQADEDGLSVRALTEAIARLGAQYGFIASHTGTDSNSINFVARPATETTG